MIMSPRRNESKKLSNVLFLKEKNFVLIFFQKKKETGRFFSHWSGFTYIKVRENDSGFNSRPIETKKI